MARLFRVAVINALASNPPDRDDHGAEGSDVDII